jgi:hypothetical protein
VDGLLLCGSNVEFAGYLEISVSGFRTVQTKPFVLDVGQTRNLDLALDVASVSSTVDVKDVADPLTYSTAAVSSLTDSQRLNDLPVNGRNWKSFMALAPGAVDGANGSNTGVRFFATAGDDENYRVDGVDATSIRNQNMRLNSRLLLSEDAIAEFRVNSALYTAETGGSIVGQVEIVTKSGSNAFHGSAFEYARNDVFDARPFSYTTALPPFEFNQFGATLGGAIIKNRTFFFLSYEGLRQTAADSGSAGSGAGCTVPELPRAGAGAIAGDRAVARRLPQPHRNDFEPRHRHLGRTVAESAGRGCWNASGGSPLQRPLVELLPLHPQSRNHPRAGDAQLRHQQR